MSFTTSDTGIANMALGHIGHGKPIGSLSTDASREAHACRVFFDNSRDEVLRDVAWPFATKYASLSLVEEALTTEWSYSYRVPADCLMFRRIQSGLRNDNRQSKVPYRIGSDSSGGLIYTDHVDAVGEYTKRLTSVEFYPPDFKTLLSMKLASYIVPLISAGDPYKMGDSLAKKYLIQLAITTANARSEEQGEELPQSELIRAREGEFGGESSWMRITPTSTDVTGA